jgi:hypothetical protein
VALSPATRRAVRRYGPSVRSIARGYRNPYTGRPLSGEALLAKLVTGESGDRAGAVSSAGARGKTQFTASTRASFMRAFGIDPWRSTDEAVHAAALHLSGALGHGKGLEGYNPGDPSYPSYILRQRVGKIGSGGGVEGLLGGGSGAPGAAQMPQGSEGIAPLLAALSEPKPAPSSGGLQAPSFAASAVMPQGSQAPVSGGGPAPKPDYAALLAAVQTLGGDVQHAPGGTAGGGGSFGGVTPGRVRVDPNADRSGVKTNGRVLRFAAQVAGVAGIPIRIGTGSNHSKYTVDGNISDHWSGNAADIPATGRRLVRLGQAALIAAGMPASKARKQTGGLFNIGPYQIIYATSEGGNHFTHLHVGVRPGRR